MSTYSQNLVTPPGGVAAAKPEDNAVSYMIATIGVVAVTLVMTAFNPILLHWFLVPVMICGVMIGKDAVHWFRGLIDVFDPRGVIGLCGVNFFWFSALIIPASDFQPYVLAGVKSLDWRPWLGVMGALNIVGIALYQWIASFIANRPFNGPVKVRRGSPMRMGWICAFAILAGFSAQAYLIARFGIYVKGDWGDSRDFITGQGVPIILRSSIPIVLIFAVTVFHLVHASKKKRSTFIVLCVLIGLTGLSLVLNSLGGNRGSTVFAAFWIAGLIHYYWRPIKHREAMIIIVFFLLFMFTFIFYKQYGTYGLKVFLNQGADAAEATGRDRVDRSFSGMLVGDLSRTNLHAYSAFVLLEEPYPYELRWGGTIPADVMSIIPRWIYPNQYNMGGYAGKHVAGTEMIRGPGKFDPRIKHGREPRMWGVAGNMILNFGLFSAPLGYVLLGAYVGWAQRATRKWRATSDIRLFLAPLLTLIGLIILAMDPQVFTMYMLRYFTLPILIVLIGSRAIGRHPVYPQQAIAR